MEIPLCAACLIQCEAAVSNCQICHSLNAAPRPKQSPLRNPIIRVKRIAALSAATSCAAPKMTAASAAELYQQGLLPCQLIMCLSLTLLHSY